MIPENLKRVKTLEDDRISSLPNDLLSRILSFLPTKHSVATTALSTRWNNLFASVPDLDFDDSLEASGAANETAFISFVERTIVAVLNKLSHVRKFRVNCEKGTYLAETVSSWIYLVSGRNLQELCVSAKNLTNPQYLHSKLYRCRALTTLKLEGNFLLFVPNKVKLPSLKTLVLSNLVLTDDKSVKKFIHGCIVLEELSLYDCVIDSISVLEISVASLKQLTLCGINGDYEILLDAPALEIFHCSSYATRGYYGDKLNSLVNAIIDIELEDEHFEDEKVSQLVNMVSNARSLVLMSDSLEASVSPYLMPTETFLNLTELTVETQQAGGWLALPNLLRSTPFLEVISFDNGLRDENGVFLESASYLPEPVPVCVSDHLKKVNVGNFFGEEYEFELVKYFLKHTKVLKEMFISPSPSCHSLNQRVCEISSMKEQFPMTRRLLKLPRRSRACQIIFDDVLF